MKNLIKIIAITTTIVGIIYLLFRGEIQNMDSSSEILKMLSIIWINCFGILWILYRVFIKKVKARSLANDIISGKINN